MKKTTLIVTLTALLAVFNFMSCKSSKEEKMEDAQENIEEAKEDVAAANNMDNSATSGTVTVEEWNSYRAGIDARIQANNERIADLKQKIKQPGKVLDNNRQKRIDELEARNAKLKQQLADYKVEAGGWVTFKADIDRELDEISKSIDETIADAKK